MSGILSRKGRKVTKIYSNEFYTTIKAPWNLVKVLDEQLQILLKDQSAMNISAIWMENSN